MTAVCGDLIAQKAQHRKLAGLIIDGYIRDLQGVQQIDLPIFARGHVVQGPTKRGPGEINTPIACGGIVVHSGDLICADSNGVVVVPRHFIATLSARLQTWAEHFRPYEARVQKGEFSNAWVDAALAEFSSSEQERRAH